VDGARGVCVLRKLHSLGYLEAGSDATVATGYDPLVDDEPALAGRVPLVKCPPISSTDLDV
jgi:hypothetical protein